MDIIVSVQKILEVNKVIVFSKNGGVDDFTVASPIQLIKNIIPIVLRKSSYGFLYNPDIETKAEK